ncbi:MAG TPA: BON domain-containing protein [Candidatus Acidoferrales bacterium]|nr:BON domain-containing protein [Candidatus Acidoferrales bacterium]
MFRSKSLTIALAASAMFVAGLSSGCSSKPKDAQLVTTIQSQMFADTQLKNANLQVAAVNGEVTLKGTVPNDAAHLEAYKIATQTPGVTKVNDQMVVDDQGAQANADTNASPADTSAPQAVPEPAPAPEKHADRAKPETRRASADRHGRDDRHAELAENSAPTPQPNMQQTPSPGASSDPQMTPQPAAPAAPAPARAVPAPPPPQPKQYVVPAGTTVSVRMIDSIDSSVNQAGEVFQASLDAPIVVDNEVVVPKGANVYVRLTSAASAGKMTGKSELRLQLVKVEYQGGSFPLVSSTYAESGKSRTTDTEKKVGGGAVLGAIIGAIAGGGKGAAIGAAAGAGAGTVYQGATHGQQVKIPSETKLDFQLDQPATITVMPRSTPASDSQSN